MFQALRKGVSKLAQGVRSIARKAVAGVAAASAASVASAQSILPADPTTLTTDLLADLAAVGPLIIGAAVAVMGIRWVKAMFF